MFDRKKIKETLNREKVKKVLTEEMSGWRLPIVVMVILAIIAFSLFVGYSARYALWYFSGKIGRWAGFFSISGHLLGVVVFLRVVVRMSRRFLNDSIREVPADPPHKAILLFLGERTNVVLSEGWRLLPFYGILYDVIVINVTKQNDDLPDQVVKTPDNADLLFRVSITWSAGRQDGTLQEQARALKAFVQSGGAAGVKKIYLDIVQGRLREWVRAMDEGPTDWPEAVGIKDAATAALVKAILGDSLEAIPSDVPTEVLLRYFSKPQKPPLALHKARWGKKPRESSTWGKLEEVLGKLEPGALAVLEAAIEARRKIVKDLGGGNGSFVHRTLGITIHLLTIKEVLLTGDVAKAVNQRVEEREQAEAEITELEHVSRRIKVLMEKHPGMSLERAIEIVQVERGKATKGIHETQVSGSRELLEKLEKVASFFGKSQ